MPEIQFTKVLRQPAESLRSNGARIANQQHSDGKVKSEASDLGMDGSITITPGVADSATKILHSSKMSRSRSLPCALCESDLPLAHGMLIRMRHQGTPLCFGLDHYVRKQGWTHNSLSQSICQSQSLMSVQVVQVTNSETIKSILAPLIVNSPKPQIVAPESELSLSVTQCPCPPVVIQ